jgi:hypothetical protein
MKEKTIDFTTIRALIEIPDIFDSLKNKYPEIEVDLLSWKDNPDCTCGQRVNNFFTEKYSIEEDKNFLDELINREEVKSKTEQITKDQIQNGIPPNMTDYRGRVFTVGIKEEDWLDFWNNKVVQDRAAYRSFSIINNGNELKVYFL